MTSIRIEQLDHREPRVARAIHEVQMLAYAQEAQLLGVEHFPPLEQTPAGIQALDERFFGAFDGEALVGAVSLESGPAPDGINIASLVVTPVHQKRGIAHQLMTKALAECGDRAVTVSTGADNLPVLKLYARFRFTEFSRHNLGPEQIEIVSLQRPADATRATSVAPVTGPAMNIKNPT